MNPCYHVINGVLTMSINIFNAKVLMRIVTEQQFHSEGQESTMNTRQQTN